MERNRQAGWLRDMERRAGGAGGAEATEEAPGAEKLAAPQQGPAQGARPAGGTRPRAAERQPSGQPRARAGQGPGSRRQPGARSTRSPAPGAGPVILQRKEAGWSLLKRKWPQHLTKGASFFLRGSRYLTRERENSARSEGSGSPRRLQRQPEAGRPLPPSRSWSGPGPPPQTRDPGRTTHAACGKLAHLSAPAQCHPLPRCPQPSESVHSPVCSTRGLPPCSCLPPTGSVGWVLPCADDAQGRQWNTKPPAEHRRGI